MDKKFKIGYTTGVFDLFHIGHLNILKKAKEQCEFLIVGVTTDDLISYKNKVAFIPFDDRIKIVECIKYVDKVVPQVNMNKMEAWENLKFEVMFVGNDWQGTERWIEFERQFKQVGVKIIYLPYTKETSSTKLRRALDHLNDSMLFDDTSLAP
jgi:glycerol-3-phosphate cytidylyltransferase